MILSTPGSISEIDRKSSSFARKIKKISALHGTYPKTTHINTHAYLCVFKRHFVGIPQGWIPFPHPRFYKLLFPKSLNLRSAVRS